MDFKELETKYNADDVSFQAFESLVNQWNPSRWMTVSSYDEYFIKEGDDFVRYRYTEDYGELTMKRKTNMKNNNNRLEVNMKVEPNDSKNVKAFIDLQGYKFNFKIFKTCRIAFLDTVTLVYYIVYDADLKEKRRFIEIEAKEDYAWPDEATAWTEVEKYEAHFSKLDISPKNRLKKSLFEIFRSEN